MNKKYQVDQEGNITVITNDGDIIKRKDKYSKNTHEILSLENSLELIQTKIKILNNKLNEHLTKKKIIKINMIIAPIVILGALTLITILSKSLYLAGLVGILSLPAVLSVELIDLILYKKSKDESKSSNQRIQDELSRTNKITKRIETLSKDKTPTKITNPNELIDVETIINFNFDASDYFIEKYQIDKRTKQMNNSKKKVRKLIKPNNSPYII